MKGKKIILGISGGIGAYKTPDIVRRIRERGGEVRIVMTANAMRFISPLSLEAVSGYPVYHRFEGLGGGDDHIALSEWGDLLLVAPATYNAAAKFASGIADDFLTTLFAASLERMPILLCPSMHQAMYRNPVLKENLKRLEGLGVEVVEPGEGALLRGEGEGRLPATDRILYEVERALCEKDLEGLRIVVSAGPTREYIDRVRFISNAASGKLGYSIAKRAFFRGAAVTLVSGPSALNGPRGVKIREVEAGNEMEEALKGVVGDAEVLIMTAAVSDWSTARVEGKIEREGEGGLLLNLTPTPDIVKGIKEEFPRIFTAAFSLEMERDEVRAREKMERKGVDLMVLNTPGKRRGFGGDLIDPVLLFPNGEKKGLGILSKEEFADILLTEIKDLLGRG